MTNETVFSEPYDHFLYGVIGNPITHSYSPWIHSTFWRLLDAKIKTTQTELPVFSYGRLTAENSENKKPSFCEVVNRFWERGGVGLNVTLPFKVDAFNSADVASVRAQLAGASNFLFRVNRSDSVGKIIHFPENREELVLADNTDGAGIVRDITLRLGVPLLDARVLLIGAGGAARGIAVSLLQQAVCKIVVSNRTMDNALGMHRSILQAISTSSMKQENTSPDKPLVDPQFSSNSVLVKTDAMAQKNFEVCALEEICSDFDVVINTTSAHYHGDNTFRFPKGVLGQAKLVYDISYVPSPSSFMCQALDEGATLVSDGLGMLIEQAAESFYLWRNVWPDTSAVYRILSEMLCKTKGN